MSRRTVICTAGAMGRHGEAGAVIAGRRVHVAYALPGERVRAEVDGSHGRAVEILAPSPERIAPVCEHFGRCGGCAVQHWHEDAYRQWKRDLVVTALAHRGITGAVGAIIDAHGAGRRRMRLTVARNGAGFLAARSHDVVVIGHCAAAVPALKAAAAIAADLGGLIGVPGRGLAV